MEYSKFQEMKISKLGFGAMRLPKMADDSIDMAETAAMVKKAMEGGVNYFDTAYTYHGGQSEKAMGEILSQYPRESYYIATKMPTWLCKCKQDVLDIFQEQLNNLKTDYVDLYLIHSIEDAGWQNCKDISVVNALLEEKAAGRIKHLGASFHCSLELLDEILSQYGPVLEFIQLQINYHDWDFAQGKELHELALKYNKPIIIMEPLRGGMLANITPETDELFRARDKEVGCNRSNAFYAFKHAAELENVFLVLSGMSTMEVLEENIKTFSAPALEKADYDVIWKVASKLKNDILIPCTGCNYCDQCPSNIKIKDVFAAYNEAASRGFVNIWASIYGPYDKALRGSDPCIKCGNCESHCPQHIEIIEKLEEIAKKYDELR